MIRKTTGLFLAFLIISQSLLNLGLYTYYNLNKKAIAEKLCINKNKPSMHCNGHCFLSKQLKQAEEKEKQQSQSIKEKEEQVITLRQSSNTFYLPSFREVGLHKPFLLKELVSVSVCIIPPPEVLSA